MAGFAEKADVEEGGSRVVFSIIPILVSTFPLALGESF